LKSGSHNHLEPSRPVQACTGIALPLRIRVTSLHGIAQEYFLEVKAAGVVR